MRGLNAGLAGQFIDRKAQRHRAPVADRILGVFQQLAHESYAVFQTAAVFVAATVAPAGDEMKRQRQVMARIHIHDVEADGARAQRRLAMPPADIGDVALGHRKRLRRLMTVHHHS